MTEYIVNSDDLTAVADAIRTKGGTSESLIFPGGFASAIANIKAGENVEQATPTISVSSDGLITASATQKAGLVAAGTKSTTKQMTTKAGATIAPTSSKQLAVNAGVFTTGAIYIDAISGNYQDINTLTTQLYNSLRYSGLVNPSMSFSEMCTALSNAYPAVIMNFLYTTASNWIIYPSMNQRTTPTITVGSSSIAFKVFKMDADSGYVDFVSPVFIPSSNSKLKYIGEISSENQVNYQGYIYLSVQGSYTQLGIYGPANAGFNNTVDLSSHAGKSCQVVIRGYNGWKKSNSDWLQMAFSTFEVSA